MHERSTDPDVVKRLQAETEWAVKAHRRYVELTPDDAVALQARITELTAALTEMLSQNLPGRVWDEKVRAALAAGEAAPRKNAFCQTCGDTVCPDCHPAATLYAANEKLHAALTEASKVLDGFIEMRRPWRMLDAVQRAADNARAALAAGTTESEA